MSYAFCVKHGRTMTLREIVQGKTIYICTECERERQQWESFRKITTALPFFLLLFCLPAHARSSVDRQYVTETVAELKDAALLVGRYERGHHNGADVLYIQRAEADITVALGTLRKYRHHSAVKQDVESVMSQLSRDLEDMPPSVLTLEPGATV